MKDDSSYAKTEAQKNWDRARQAVFIESLISILSRRSANLLSFDEIKEHLKLSQVSYRGIQEIPIDHIRGSVGRYQDFSRTFLPRKTQMRDRWKRIDALAITEGFSPIEVYQVGEAYFVLDGNHRVSVARQAGVATIEAHVWAYSTPAGLSAEADIDEVLTKAEYVEFLALTRLDQTRPDHAIRFTAPGAYRNLSYHVAMYKLTLEDIDQGPVSFEEAAAAWYDMVYTPAITIIRERGVMERFPDRTEADLFAWVWKHHKELESRGITSLVQAADDIAHRSFLTRLARLFRHRKSG
nr:hypothetical protein [Anaerolineae bacterium]